jgi:hypothetical protein
MKKLIFGGLCLSLVALALVGCGKKDSVENMSRADQEKAFQGNRDPNFLKQMQDKYSKSGAQARPAPPASGSGNR